MIFGATIPPTFVINEVTTVAACYAAAQLITAGIVIEGTVRAQHDHIYLFDSAGNFLGGFQGGGIDGPWGITLDGDDNL